MGIAEIHRRMLDSIGRKGNGLESDAQAEARNTYGDAWTTVGTLLCGGTTVNRERTGRTDRTRYSPKGG